MSLSKITGQYHVVGYHLPITPTNYTIELFQKPSFDSSLVMISRFDISHRDGCCIPFCCLFPKCSKRKEVRDHFLLEYEHELILQSSTAFNGLITCLKKGKSFRIFWANSYLLLVNQKEIFVLSPTSDSPSSEERFLIKSAISEIDFTLTSLPLSFS